MPKFSHSAHRGVSLDIEDGLLLTAETPFEASTLDEVAGCLQSASQRKVTDVEATIRQKLKEEWRGRNC